MIVEDGLLCGFVQFELCADFGLLRPSVERVNLILLRVRWSICCSSFFAVLFQELIEQHRVHLVVTDGVDRAIGVARTLRQYPHRHRNLPPRPRSTFRELHQCLPDWIGFFRRIKCLDVTPILKQLFHDVVRVVIKARANSVIVGLPNKIEYIIGYTDGGTPGVGNNTAASLRWLQCSKYVTRHSRVVR